MSTNSSVLQFTNSFAAPQLLFENGTIICCRLTSRFHFCTLFLCVANVYFLGRFRNVFDRRTIRLRCNGLVNNWRINCWRLASRLCFRTHHCRIPKRHLCCLVWVWFWLAGWFLLSCLHFLCVVSYTLNCFIFRIFYHGCTRSFTHIDVFQMSNVFCLYGLIVHFRQQFDLLFFCIECVAASSRSPYCREHRWFHFTECLGESSFIGIVMNDFETFFIEPISYGAKGNDATEIFRW